MPQTAMKKVSVAGENPCVKFKIEHFPYKPMFDDDLYRKRLCPHLRLVLCAYRIRGEDESSERNQRIQQKEEILFLIRIVLQYKQTCDI